MTTIRCGATGGFYATAIHWYKEAERISSTGKEKPQAKRLQLEAAGKTSDPKVSKETMAFPGQFTRGLQMQFQPAGASGSSAQSGSQKGGCGGTAALLITVFGVIVRLLHG